MENSKNPFLLRPHHLNTIKSEFYTTHKGWINYNDLLKPYSLKDAYTADNNLINHMSACIARREARRAESEFGRSKYKKEYWRDFIGKNGELSVAFRNSYCLFINALLSAAPTEKVIIKSEPDIICLTCQINGPRKEGNHCNDEGNSITSSNADERGHRVLMKLIERGSYSEELHLVKDGDFKNSIIIANMGLVRDEDFLTYVYNESRQIWFNEY